MVADCPFAAAAATTALGPSDPDGMAPTNEPGQKHGGGATTTGPDATHPPNYLSKLGGEGGRLQPVLMRPTPPTICQNLGGGGATTTGPDATHPPNYLSKLGGGGGATTTGPDATHPPTICQNLGGGGGQLGANQSVGKKERGKEKGKRAEESC